MATGVTLKIDGCYVVVQGSIEKKQVDISVEGNQNKYSMRQALSIVRSLFDIVHERHSEIDPVAVVPLPDNPENEIEYGDLLHQEGSLGSDHKVVLSGSRIFTVGELLNGVDLRSQQKELLATYIIMMALVKLL